MNRVLEEHSKVGGDLAPEPVHDLRVALRRCILIADVMRDLDPSADWNSMRKAARRIFNRLGALRDTQILAEWIEKLRSTEDDSTQELLKSLKAQYEKDRSLAKDALKKFDRKQWRAWMRDLVSHYRHVAGDRSACESLVFDNWQTALNLHRSAQKSRSRIAYHRLRVALKKFRYGVENFLPWMYPAWETDLKFVQDLLGEAHDLSVLEQAMAKHRIIPHEETRVAWHKKLEAERLSRIQQYRAKMAGESSPLWVWREGLPAERELRAAGLSRLAEWAYFVTPDVPRVRRVARLSLQLYDGLSNCGLVAKNSNIEGRYILQAAALLQEVGHFKKGKAHHKESYRMIRKISPPAGWSKRDIEMTASIARFHRRALPRADHKILRAYEFPLRNSLVLLAAILRFANAFHAKPYRSVRRLEVEDVSGVIVVRADGFPDREPLSSKLSVARRLLESTCQRAVHILPPGTRPDTRVMSPQIVQPAKRSDAA
jgi:CHAD domain-containing protein